MPFLAFPPILAGEGLSRWLLLLVIIIVMAILGRVVYRLLSAE